MAQTQIATRQLRSATTEIEVDFGTTPTITKTFTVTDANVTTANLITAVASAKTATDRVGNDSEWDAIIYTASSGTGNFQLTAHCVTGAVVGKRKVNYTVG